MAKRVKNKSKRKRNKVLLFLVEGDSDAITLEAPMEAFLDNEGIEGITIKFAKLAKRNDGQEMSGGDPTSDIDIYPGNIEDAITRRIDRKTDEGTFIYPQEVVRIVQIVDMDGAYVENHDIIERPTGKGNRKENRVYFEDRIETDNKFATERNLQRKRENLDYLSGLKTFKFGSKNIEYSIYYFSSNLEHFMYGIQNMERYKKVSEAKNFALECLDNPKCFLDKMKMGDYLLNDQTYEESWNYIRQRGLKSLSRMSNINIMLTDLVDWGKRFMEEHSVLQQE